MGEFNYFAQSPIVEDDNTSSGTANEDKSVAPSGSANTKGSYVEFFAALPFSVMGFTMECRSNNAGYALFDIAIGAAGSEVVIVPNFSDSYGLSARTRRSIFIPVSIPKGTRVALRTQCSSGGAALSFKMRAHAAGFNGVGVVSQWFAWGADTSNSRPGPSVTAGGSANTKGSWVQLVAATEITTKWLAVAMSIAASPRDFSTDIGIGAGGSEVVLIPSISFAGEDLGQILGPFPVTIPKGTRIAARTQCEIASSALQVGCWGGG
jgi:hypothetical protein